MITIKIDSGKHSQGVIKMVRDFHKITPHTTKYGLSFDEESFSNSLRFYCSDKYHCVFVATENETLVGVLLGEIKQSFFNSNDLIAQEIIWWVDPEHRGKKIAIELLSRFKDWSRMYGAAVVIMGSIDALEGKRVGVLYERNGFNKEEAHYFARA